MLKIALSVNKPLSVIAETGDAVNVIDAPVTPPTRGRRANILEERLIY